MLKPKLTLALVAALLLLAVALDLSAARPALAPFGGLQRLRAHSSQFRSADGSYHDEFLFVHGNDSISLKCTLFL